MIGMESPDGCGRAFAQCFFCKAPESKKRPLKRCSGCQLLAYCSKDCQKDDWRWHGPICKEFPTVNGRNVLHTTGPWEEHIANLRKQTEKLQYVSNIRANNIFRNPKVCHTCRESQSDLLTICKCTCVCYCSKKFALADNLHIRKCKKLRKKSESYSLTHMRDSYPYSFLQAINDNDEFGRDYCRLKDLTTLNVHVITSTAYFDAKAWECLFDEIPSLKQLTLSFVIQGMAYNQSFDRCERLTKQRCNENKSKNFVIKYSVHQKPYHMFFSSPKYTEPDFVVAFGIPCVDSDINSEISYRNMLYCKHTVLILMDSAKDLVVKGAHAVNQAIAVKVLMPVNRNRQRSFGSNLSDLDFDAEAANERYYMTSLYKTNRS